MQKTLKHFEMPDGSIVSGTEKPEGTTVAYEKFKSCWYHHLYYPTISISSIPINDSDVPTEVIRRQELYNLIAE